MKTTIYSLLAAAACGMAFGQTQAYTGAVGYETLALNPGFNFVGVRLHESPLASGTLESFATGPNRVTDTQTNLGALITGGATYILELQDGSGIIQEVTSATGTALNVAADLSTATGGVTYPCSYTLRKASTLNSLFGGTVATCKLSIGSGSVVGADQLWFFTGTGYTKIYFDAFGGPSELPGWYTTAGATVSGDTPIVYADGFIISSAIGKDVTVTGDLKDGSTELNLVTGFNFVSSIGPVGMTLGNAYGNTKAEVLASGVAIGAGSVVGADQFWFFTGSGYTKVYFDAFGGPSELPGWYTTSGAVYSPTNVLPPGYIISASTPGDMLSKVPAFYTGL